MEKKGDRGSVSGHDDNATLARPECGAETALTPTTLPPTPIKYETGSSSEGTCQFSTINMATVELRAEDLYDKEKVDLEGEDLGNIFGYLQCNEKGLTEAEAERRVTVFGRNALEAKDPNPILQFLSFMWNPLSWVMEGAAIVAIVFSNGEGKPPDWPDFVGIVLLLLLNSTIGFVEERKAGNAVKALMESLAPKAKVKRNGVWRTTDAAELVPGDVIAFKIGDIIPADCRLFDALDVSIDQAALTGESLPVSKKLGDSCFSGSICKAGEAEGIVIATGANTFFGRAAALVGEDDNSAGHLQQVLARIGLFCICVIGVFVIVEIAVLAGAFHLPYRTIVENLLVLLVGGIPVAMPTVLSVTMAVGAKMLAKHKAIVSRISSIEELAGVDILVSDKTGTLTTNRLTVDEALVRTYSNYSASEVITIAAFCSRTENSDAIDACIVGTAGGPDKVRTRIHQLRFLPFNPSIKRTEATYVDLETGRMHRASKGMSPVIVDLCTRNKTAEQVASLERDVDEFAQRGLRALAVCIEDVSSGLPDDQGNGFELIGLLAIFDPPRSDTKQTLEKAQALGIKVVMATGDALAIAKETGRRLGLGDNMFDAQCIKSGRPPVGSRYSSLEEAITNANGFAGVFPEHKVAIVKTFQKQGHLVAMTGDGANDAPALSRADVGIAVEGATDAARGAADIVLVEPGLSTIIEAVRGSRVIFQRMRNYSIYATSVTIRVVVGYSLMAFVWRYSFPPFLVLLIAFLNDGTCLTVSTDRVRPSGTPNSWRLVEIFTYAWTYGLLLTGSTMLFYHLVYSTTFFDDTFGLPGFHESPNQNALHTLIYLQTSLQAQALIFITRSHGPFFMDMPSLPLLGAFVVAQTAASLISGYATWEFAHLTPISAGWIGIVWGWTLLWMFPVDVSKYIIRALLRVVAKPRRRSAKLEPQPEDKAATSGLYAQRVSYLKRSSRMSGFHKPVHVASGELAKVSSIQVARASARLSRVPQGAAARY